MGVINRSICATLLIVASVSHANNFCSSSATYLSECKRMMQNIAVVGRAAVRSPYFVPASLVSAFSAVALYLGLSSEKNSVSSSHKRKRQSVRTTAEDSSKVFGAPGLQRPDAMPATNDLQDLTFGAYHVKGRGLVIPASGNRPMIVRIEQAVVLDQFSDGWCGNATCGYHALKNACALSLLAQGVDGAAMLTNKQVTQKLFGCPLGGGSVGTWRHNCINGRNRARIQRIFEADFGVLPVDKVASFGLKSEKIRGIYSTFMGNFARTLAARLWAGESITITRENVFEWILAQAQDYVIADPAEYGNGTTRQAIMQRVCDPEIIFSYIKLPDYMDKKLGLNTFSTRLDRDAQWLGAGEVERLAEQVRHDYQHLAQLPIMVFESVDERQLASQEVHGYYDQLMTLRRAIQTNADLPTNIYAFILGSMRHETIDTAGMDHGHWVTLVLDATQKGQRRYILADSAHNSNQISSGPCHEFIRFLEGQEVCSCTELLADMKSIVPDMMGSNWFSRKFFGIKHQFQKIISRMWSRTRSNTVVVHANKSRWFFRRWFDTCADWAADL